MLLTSPTWWLKWLSWRSAVILEKRQVKSVGIFWFLSREGRAQIKGKLGYDEGNL